MTPLAKLAENSALTYLVSRSHDRLDPPSEYIAATEDRFRDAIRRAIREERERLDAVGWCPGFWADTLPARMSESDERHEAECAAADAAYDRERGA